MSKPAGTFLTMPEELAFRDWMQRIGHTHENGFFVDQNFNGLNYDYRGYFKKYGGVNLGPTDHLTDEFKLPSHPTFSNESVYATGLNAARAGRWDGETYIPSPANFLFQGLDPLVNALMNQRKKQP